MRVFEHGAIVVEWYPEERLFTMWFRAKPDLSGEAARTITRWLGAQAGPGPILALVDGRGAVDASLIWKLEWADFFAPRPGSRFAVHGGLPTGLRAAVGSFFQLARIEGAFVPDQETGLAWLEAANAQAAG